MKKYFVVLLFLWISVYNVKAQFLDSIQTALERKGRFTFSLDSYSSFIDNNDADISGFLVGVCFDRRFTIGGGYNFLDSYLTRNEVIEGNVISRQLNFGFLCYYMQYQFKITKHWEIDIPLTIGLGSSSYSYTLQGKEITQDKQFVMPIEPSVEVDYDFNKYWGLYVQVGFRWMLINNTAISADFNSPTYDFGVFICPFEIYAGLFPKTKLAHMIEDN